MLAMADRLGRVWASIPGLANRARVPVESVEKAIKCFSEHDPYSRTKDFDGRRIEEIDGGWRLLNYVKYRSIRDEEAILESKRKYINTKRGVERVEQGMSTVDRCRHNAEAEAEAEEENEVQSSTSNPAKDQPPQLTLDVQTKDTRKPPSTQHSAFILGWCDNYKSKFGCDYKMEGGRDGKAVKKLLSMGITMIDLLEIAKKAWNKIPDFECRQSVTIHGFYERFNQIQIAVNGKINHATNQPNHQQRPNRNIGTANAEVDPQLYAAAARRQSSTQ
jgi:hypothetical protein